MAFVVYSGGNDFSVVVCDNMRNTLYQKTSEFVTIKKAGNKYEIFIYLDRLLKAGYLSFFFNDNCHIMVIEKYYDIEYQTYITSASDTPAFYCRDLLNDISIGKPCGHITLYTNGPWEHY